MELFSAVQVLVLRAAELQAEVVARGKGGASPKDFYKRNHRWTQGLISGAKAVALACQALMWVGRGTKSTGLFSMPSIPNSLNLILSMPSIPNSLHLILSKPSIPSSLHLILSKPSIPNYASPTSGEAYRDRRLTTNFELWVEIFCVYMFPCEDSKTVSVCPSVRLSVRTPRKEIVLASSISVLH